MGSAFYLVNLVREAAEKGIQESFSSALRVYSDRCFLRWTWEDIYRNITNMEG